MNCPECDKETYVIDSRPRAKGTIYRRRDCSSCGHRFSTYELPETDLDGLKFQAERAEGINHKLIRQLRLLRTRVSNAVLAMREADDLIAKELGAKK